MKRVLVWVLVVGVCGLGLAQLKRPMLTNPPETPGETLWTDERVPAEVVRVLERGCADCHSHRTVWPWYAQVSPASWLLWRHVEEGREKLNFSDWTGASANTRAKILGEVESGSMAPKDYLLLHPGAKLGAADVEVLRRWAAKKK